MSQNNYDFIVVGSGLPGLIIATVLSQHSKKVALFESSETFGGCHKKITNPSGHFDNGIRFFPNTDSSHSAIDFLEKVTGVKLLNSVMDTQTVFYEGGQFKPFVGFGDQKIEFYEELAYFLSSEEIQLTLPFYQIPELIMRNFKGDFLPRSIVTKFNSESDDKITSITINGTKKVTADQIIFCGSIKDLALLLPNDYLSARAKNKITKTTYWTSICLDIVHNSNTGLDNKFHVLDGTTQDDLGPCFGKIMAINENLSFSQWITFVDEEQTDDSEVTANALKKMKRQIKRAYPTFLDNIGMERIFIYSNYAGDGVIKLNANQTVPGFDNLWISSSTVNLNKNLVGAIKQAELVLSGFGFNVENQLVMNNNKDSFEDRPLSLNSL